MEKTECAENKDLEYKNMFPRGEEFKSPYYSGKMWMHMIVDRDNDSNCPITNDTYEPQCRSNWHNNAGGQILLCISGTGYYQQRNEKIRKLCPGDVVQVPPDVEHWHGATPESWFSHLTIEVDPDKGPATWLDPVSDNEYNNYFEEVSIDLTETAIRNHELLWPDDRSKLKLTDPELIEMYENFSLDEVLQDSGLDLKTIIMVIVASNIACGGIRQYRLMIRAALNVGVSPVELKEMLYQSVPYVGFSRVNNYLYSLNDELISRGVKLPLPGQSDANRCNRLEKGAALQKAIFGDVADRLYEYVQDDQKRVIEYISDNCYGDYMSRGGIDIKTRELLILVMLISMGMFDSTLVRHITGNINLGNDKAMLIDVVTQLIPYIGYPRALCAIRCINETVKVSGQNP